MYPLKKGKKIFGICGANPFPQNLKLEENAFENARGV